MNATIWISGRVARVILKDKEGRVVDLCDDWNNIASAESWVYDGYPEAKITTVRKDEQRKELDHEWDRCKLGIG